MTAPNPDDVAADVRAWRDASWDPDLSLLEWRGRLADSGWGCPTWPAEWYGRGLPTGLAEVVHAEFDRVGAVGTPAGGGIGLAAPTILEHGSDELKGRLLRPIVTGEHTWCQLFSEPGSGSDLAGLTTRAERDGDEWVVSGQKVWNTSAHHAAYGMLLARTDWSVPKHRGITYFAIEMQQPGVTVRPLRQMNGHASFNEVFLDEARVPVANVIGDVGNGWNVALATLAHERRFNPVGRGGAPRGASARVGRAHEEAAREAAEQFEPYKWYPQRAGRADLVPSEARRRGVDQDPTIRQQVAHLHALTKVSQWTARRAAAARALGRPPGPEGSLGKLGSSDIARASALAHTRIAGPFGMLRGDDDGTGGIVTEVLVSVPAVSIAGGTDEIQHNILGEQMLGLPREPSVDRDIPFRQIRRTAP
jgi:alkylation response protein AidB-like acyl-CoA dehydrogenase